MLKNSELSIGYEKNALIESGKQFEYSLSNTSGLLITLITKIFHP